MGAGNNQDEGEKGQSKLLKVYPNIQEQKARPSLYWLGVDIYMLYIDCSWKKIAGNGPLEGHPKSRHGKKGNKTSIGPSQDTKLSHHINDDFVTK